MQNRSSTIRRVGLCVVAGLALARAAGAADAPEPFDGRLEAVAVASRWVTVDGVSYPLAGTAQVFDHAGKPTMLRESHAGQRVRIAVAAPAPDSQGPAPVLTLTLLND